MTETEAKEMIVTELEDKGYKGIDVKSITLAENSIRAAVSYSLHGLDSYKEIIILRVTGQWKVLA